MSSSLGRNFRAVESSQLLAFGGPIVYHLTYPFPYFNGQAGREVVPILYGLSLQNDPAWSGPLFCYGDSLPRLYYYIFFWLPETDCACLKFDFASSVPRIMIATPCPWRDYVGCCQESAFASRQSGFSCIFAGTCLAWICQEFGLFGTYREV